MTPSSDAVRAILEGQRDLVAWLLDDAEPAEHRLAVLRQLHATGLIRQVCDLADLQAQVMLSRYRPALVGRLLNVAMNDDAPPEQVRRALVDLLKLDLRPRGAVPEADAEDRSLVELPTIYRGEPKEEA
jgi:hypothetical protein